MRAPLLDMRQAASALAVVERASLQDIRAFLPVATRRSRRSRHGLMRIQISSLPTIYETLTKAVS